MSTPVADSASAQPKAAATATPSTSAPVAPSTSTGRPTPQPKKKKKSGLASFFAALGCGSSEPLEDKRKPAMSEIHGQSGSATKSVGTKPVAAVAPTKDAPKPTADSTEVTLTEGDNAAVNAARTEPPKAAEANEEAAKNGPTGAELGLGAVVGTGAVAGAAVAAHAAIGDDAPKEEAVVVAPATPVHVPEDETAGVTSAAVQPPGSGSALLAAGPPTPDDKTQSSDYVATDSNTGSSSQQDYNMMAAEDEEEEDDEDRLVAQGGLGIPVDQDGREMPLLPPMDKVHAGRKCLVLDLDETLLHSSFKMIPNADYIVPVEIESQTHNVYVIKRPGVDNFLQKMGEIYEVVVFTASLSKYADPVLDMLDIHHVVRHRLFRESCYNHKGNYVKDLSQLGRTMESCIIIDNSPASYIFHPNNAVPVSTWFNDPHDTELTDLCPFLTDLGTVDDIRGVLDGSL